MEQDSCKTITLCGSIAFYDEMLVVKAELEGLGYYVKLPPTEIKNEEGVFIPVQEYYTLRKAETGRTGWIWDRKSEAITNHFEKIASSDAILVLNFEKNGIAGYVGGNTLMEIGIAFYLGKKIYFYEDLPEMSYTEELIGMHPIMLNHDLSFLRTEERLS
jgi:hypothetical protein